MRQCAPLSFAPIVVASNQTGSFPKIDMESIQSPKVMRVVIADDEPLARERIRELLEREGDYEVISECSDGLGALSALRQGAADLVFLDVEMPKLDGFGVLEALGGGAQCAVIFVTGAASVSAATSIRR